ncbi:MAG TPA: hypothetical protein VKP67_23220, partial [Xanthobacteraceae bacterium]|nr:hypothetical protein [Xanthobacteraceae bacterium]
MQVVLLLQLVSLQALQLEAMFAVMGPGMPATATSGSADIPAAWCKCCRMDQCDTPGAQHVVLLYVALLYVALL